MRRYTRLLLSLLLFAVNTALCEDVTGYIGDNVLLPCVYTEDDPGTGVSVFWKDKNDKVVLNIIKGVEDVSSQERIFTGRVKSFPKEYQKGNFSIVLKNINKTDDGDFECGIPSSGYNKRVRLTVTDNPVSEGTNNAAVDLTPPLLTLFCLLFSLT